MSRFRPQSLQRPCGTIALFGLSDFDSRNLKQGLNFHHLCFGFGITLLNFFFLFFFKPMFDNDWRAIILFYSTRQSPPPFDRETQGFCDNNIRENSTSSSPSIEGPAQSQRPPEFLKIRDAITPSDFYLLRQDSSFFFTIENPKVYALF